MSTLPWGFALGMFVPIISHAAGIQISDQSIQSFLEPNHYVELSYAELYANVSGQLPQTKNLKQLGVQDFSTGNLVNDYHFVNVAAKLELTPKFSFGLIYDRPYGANIDYQYNPKTDSTQQILESGSIKFYSENISLILGYQPSTQWNLYAGTAYQQFGGELNVFGENYSVMSGYHAKFNKSNGQGWLAGLSYQIPEYAFKTALTYRSKIEHKSNVKEDLLGQDLEFVPFSKTEFDTPQSVNLDFQTGLSHQFLLYSSLRWVNWKNFAIQPTQFGGVVNYFSVLYPNAVTPFNLIDYRKDQWSAKLGLARSFTNQWSGTTEFLWDSGNDNPSGTLNPSNGYHGLGLAAIYKPRSNCFFAYGINYVEFNKSKAKSLNTSNPITENSLLSEVSKNYAFAHGIKIGYHF